MNWSPSSRVATVLLALVLLATVVGPVAAAEVSNPGVTSSSQVGDSMSATYEVTDLYTDYNSWTLRGSTDLQSPVWTVTTYDQTGAQLAQSEYTNGTFTHTVAAKDNVNKVTVKLSGETPEVEDFSYRPPQRFTFARLEQVKGESTTTLRTSSVRPYTAESDDARSAIREAEQTINASAGSGVDVSEARASLQNAVSAYENGNFDLATDLATEAQSKAEGAAASKQQTNLLLMVGAGVVVVLVVLGAVYWYLQNRQTYDKLG